MKTLDTIDERYFLMTNIATKPPKIGTTDVAICCPVCKEGNSWGRKQRCHLYIKDSFDKAMVHCYNCGIHHNLENYLSIIDDSLVIQYKREKFKDKLDELKPKEKIVKSKVKKEKEPNVFLNIGELPFRKHTREVRDYLKTRGLEQFQELFYYCSEDVFLENKYLPIKNSIITPLLFRGKVYGFQARRLDTKLFSSFLPAENAGYKAWNFFNIDKTKPVFIFESVFDALSSGLSLSNITSALGSDFSSVLLEELKYPIFALDNHNIDETSKSKYTNIAENGGNCVILPNNIKEKDFNMMLMNGWSFEKIKELIKNNVERGVKAQVKLSF
jgi:hypothetical protein